MEEKLCGDCKHFQQHYVLIKDVGFVTANCGHCFFNVGKNHKNLNVCQKFEKVSKIQVDNDTYSKEFSPIVKNLFSLYASIFSTLNKIEIVQTDPPKKE